MNFGVTDKKMNALIKRMEACKIKEFDLDETFIRASGPGGQKTNKTATAVRLLHRPTGLEVKMAKERTQSLNRYYARKRLCELIEDQTLGPQSPRAKKEEKIRKQKQRRKRRTTDKTS